MNFVFKCPLCKMQKHCADEDVGKTYICSWCNKNVIITAPGTFSVVCPKCKSVLTTDTEIAWGTKIQCGSCEHKFVFVDKKKDFSNALKQHQKKKQQESDDLTKGCLIILCSIVGLFLVFWAIWEYTGRFCRPPASSSNSDVTSNSYPPKKITKEMVIAQKK